MRKTIEVVDEFYRDPMQVRKLALQSEWIPASDDEPRAYDARTIESFTDDEATARIAAILGIAGGDMTTLSGYFTFVGEGGRTRLVPHVHDTDYAAIVYLSLPEEFSSGIAFYRSAARQAAGLWGSDGLHTVDHPDGWEETMYVPMRFNRMVLFRASSVFHRAGVGFGDAPESGRLAHVFLFNQATAF